MGNFDEKSVSWEILAISVGNLTSGVIFHRENFCVKHTYFQSLNLSIAKRILKAGGSSVQVIDIMGGKNWINLQSF